jgi:hypothetical protein
MDPAAVDVDELIEFWILLDEDRQLLVGKRAANALGFALLLKYYSRHGRFPRDVLICLTRWSGLWQARLVPATVSWVL